MTRDSVTGRPDGQTMLEERARRLARREVQAPEPPSIDLLTFALGPIRYGIDYRVVREVVRLVSVTPVPGAPDFLLGVTNYRGQVLALFDLRGLFGVPAAPLNDLSRILVLGDDAPEFGLLADRAEATTRVALADIQPTPDVSGTAGQNFYRGVASEGVIVLDGDILLRDERLVVEYPAPAPRTRPDASV